MIKGCKNAKKNCYKYTSDFTVQDFANSKPGRYSGLREKKYDKSKSVITKEVTSMSADVGKEEEWFDKDIDDFDLTVEDQDLEAVEEATAVVKVRSSKKHPCCKTEDCTGVTYPIDLWFQLSQFIYPESILTFALLCKSSNAVLHSAQFWKQLYLRVNKDDNKSLPGQLAPNTMEYIHGLRVRVIKMMNYIYAPFVIRTQTVVPFENEPHRLVGQRCLLYWHRKVKNVWKCCFKFRKGDDVDVKSDIQRSVKSPLFDKWHQDLFYNPDNGCSVLEVTCPNFSHTPVVMGLILNKVYFNVSAGNMRYYKLKLILDTSFRDANAKNQMSMCELILDQVLEVRVYPWWHPKFDEAHAPTMDNES